MSHLASSRLPFIAAIALAVATAGCFKKRESGCEKDTDCKGDRVCLGGECRQPVGKDNAVAKQKPVRPLGPQGMPAPVQNPNVLAQDGLPVIIPSPGSSPPSVAEWNSVLREVTVSGSSALNCETKMMREWLRVNCRRSGVNAPIDVRTEHSEGQQAYVYKNIGTLTSAVVQVVRGRQYRASFVWDSNGRHWGSTLTVSWPPGAPRPTLYFSGRR
jgi:hypothetical protein